MTTATEETREGNFPAVDQKPESTAGAGARVRASVALPARLPSKEVTQRVQRARKAAGAVARYLDRPGSLAHAHPPAFARAREMHHERAGRHSVPAFRVARLVWGYWHLLLIKPVLNGIEWATETPLRFLGALLLALIVWKCS